MITKCKKLWQLAKSEPYVASAVGLILIGVLIVLIYLYMLSNKYELGNEHINITETGAFGDFVGGFVGTMFSLAGFIVVYLTFKDQKLANAKEKIDNRFTSLIEIHINNVRDINYNNPYGNES
jgi:hypothetical protein